MTLEDRRMPHTLTVDLEEWYQAFSNVDPERWNEFERRCRPAVETILTQLESGGHRATFFVVGEVAEHDPALVREIADAGHEIASHSTNHRRIMHLSEAEFREDIRRSKATLEDIIGAEVAGFRAPWWSITLETLHALRIVHEEGFRYDSSVVPARYNGFYGIGAACPEPHLIEFADTEAPLIELPATVARWAGVRIPVGGGIYWRVLPARFIMSRLTAVGRGGNRAMLYIHPWELDREHPRLPVGVVESTIHYTRLAKAQVVLRRILDRFELRSIRDDLASIADDTLPRFRFATAPTSGYLARI